MEFFLFAGLLRKTPHCSENNQQRQRSVLPICTLLKLLFWHYHNGIEMRHNHSVVPRVLATFDHLCDQWLMTFLTSVYVYTTGYIHNNLF